MSACDACLRRAALLAALGEPIERAARAKRHLPALLTLDDDRLARAVGAERASGQGDREALEAMRRASADLEIVPICMHDDRFPSSLRHGTDACRAIFVRGRLPLLDQLAIEPAVAIVGARRASSYGLEVAHTLAHELAASGIPVVSGMAFGVDAAAHRGTLEAGGHTVAVLACGLDSAYPARHRDLSLRIAGTGLLMSEYPVGFKPRRWCFPARNRIIAGLAAMTVVVEGRDDSGSLITAQFAQDLGRELGAVPGPVTSQLGRGTNQLIVDGAVVVRDAQDVLDALYGVGVRQRRPTDHHRLADLDPKLRSILEQVEDGRATPESLAGSELSAAEVLAKLSELELLGLVRCDQSGRFIRCL